jgi:phosphate transport system substrate-binding protein
VTPSRAAVENGRYAPLSRPLFIYVKHKSVERPEVKRFVEFYLTNAAALTAQVKYVPLPSAAYEMATKNFRAGKLGTAFKDIPVVGLKIEDVLQREAAL